MRISDWSSDVCSSDLIFFDEHIIKADRAGVGCVLAELVLDLVDAIARRVGRHDEAADAALAGGRIGDCVDDCDAGDLRRRDELLAATQSIAAIDLDRARADCRGVRTGIGLGQRKRRSEEHTSELKSLMRISYAVFCLKKKTKSKK